VVRVVTAGGAIRSGKTQACGRLIVEWAVEKPATYLVARSTYRSLKDTTQKASTTATPPSGKKGVAMTDNKKRRPRRRKRRSRVALLLGVNHRIASYGHPVHGAGPSEIPPAS
jgi:hypothetical protein